MIIHDRIAEQLPEWRDRVATLTGKYGKFKICDVTVEQIYGGIRGVQIQVTDISYLNPFEGIYLRGYSIKDVLDFLPHSKGAEYPMCGGLYYLLMVGSLPTEEEAWEVEEIWRQNCQVPQYVWDVLNALPPETHPMTLLSTAITALQPQAIFPPHYGNGTPKTDYWKYFVDDSMNLVSKLMVIAAYIYNKKYQNDLFISPDPNLDWAANFAHMIGKGDSEEYKELCRLFFLIHSDHEGGNVSAHTGHLVCSALSDVYLTSAAAMNGLAGPLHGLANQECLRWLLGVYDHFGSLPTESELATFLEGELQKGNMIPGYGHAVLRTTDPRFTVQAEFGQKYMPDDEIYCLVQLVYKVLPPLLKKQGKVKNPWPNVDAINGALQYHYGIIQYDFYTVLFGVSRILGITAHAVWARALGKPIERPKSLTTRMLEEMVGLPPGA
jgi:citrate synthase